MLIIKYTQNFEFLSRKGSMWSPKQATVDQIIGDHI
jgi:hypothetical protein